MVRASSTETDKGDATAEFFTALAGRAAALPATRPTGTVRFDLVNGKKVEQWFLRIGGDSVSVSPDDAAADTVFRSTRDLFEQAIRGEANLFAARLRGAVTVEGDLRLAMLVHKLFPGRSRHSAAEAAPS